MSQSIRRRGSLDSRIHSSKRLLNTKKRRPEFFGPDMLETMHEIAIYVHRFHNLDLFQQGWYQIKITARWEDSSSPYSCGIPSRVIQYEAPSLVSNGLFAIWRINDVDHSFSTQPFNIKYARQDVPLSIMVSFNFSVGKDERPSRSGVILKFELMYASSLKTGHERQATFDMFPIAVHEFRIPPKALLGLHSYCPVHFDVFHAVLVDLSVHIVYRNATSIQEKVSSASLKKKSIGDEFYDGPNQILGRGWSSKAIEMLKSLFVSRELLLEETKNLSKAIDRTIDDLHNTDLNLGRYESIGSSLVTKLSTSSAGNGITASKMGVGHLAGMLHNVLEKSDVPVDFGNDLMLDTLSKEELLDVFFTVGNQLTFMWNTFLKFQRINRTSILDHLHGIWAINRKTEWSIWMVNSKNEVHQHYLKSKADDCSNHNALGKIGLKKVNIEPAQSALTRAELHRRTIAQMKFNSHSIQDMHIFSDPSRVPVVLIEQHVMTLPNNTSVSWHTLDLNDAATLKDTREGLVPKFSLGPRRSSGILRAVVFVHGFQGHHLDLRLVKNQWLLIDSGAECLLSEANEDKTTGDFREMGNRLAREVIAFLRKKMDKLLKYGGCKGIKLSFVGHSIGNIIIRCALTETIMEPFLKHLHTYVSVSGPHLAYFYNSNSLFNSGLWLLRKLKGTPVIHQLTSTDDPELQNTFFYKLCKRKTLENFKNIILLSSPQDGYVPYHSARIELCQAASWDQSKKAHIFMDMLNNCLDQIHAPSSERRVFMRCDVNFDTSNQVKNLNTLIGRAAHIEFLETDIFARFIMWSFPEYFL